MAGKPSDVYVETVAVLGGSCFMGRRLVEHLAQSPRRPGERLVVLNRGNGYWGCPPMCSSEQVLWHPLDWDDKQSIRRAAHFLFASPSPPQPGQLLGRVTVVDFSCDTAKQMARFLSAIKEIGAEEDSKAAAAARLAHYFLISSDSVYDGEGVTKVEETNPTVALLAAAVSRRVRRSYAYQKALIEEALAAGSPAGTVRTVLRLPDVIGPYDPTGRYWATLLWALSGQPLRFPSAAANQVVSIVFSEDVALFLAQAVRCGDAWSGGTFNLACCEAPTLADLTLMIIGTVITQPQLQLQQSDEDGEETCDFYPSVVCGPLSIEKASAPGQAVPWRPTPLPECLARTTPFFMSVDRSACSREWAKVLRKLPAAVRTHYVKQQDSVVSSSS